MTPKEKAQELIEKYPKQCALISVEEILNDDWYIATREYLIARKEYWNEVKTQIEKL